MSLLFLQWTAVMRCLVAGCILSVAAGVSRNAGAQTTDVPVDVYERVSAYVLRSEYVAAEEYLGDYISSHPGDPAGFLFLAGVLQYAATDYEDYSRADEFYACCDSAEMHASTLMEQYPGDPWPRYYHAASRSMRGVWEVTAGSLLKGIIAGRGGAHAMERIITDNPAFYDACLTVGSYRFWKSVALEPVDWLPFVDDDQQEGIRQVETAVHRGKLNGPLSMTVLLEMLLEHDPARAVEEGERMVGRYPRCRLFAWQLGEAYKKERRFDEAEGVFTRLAATFDGDSARDGSGRLRCWWKLAVSARDTERPEACRRYCRRVVAFDDEPAVRHLQAERIHRARELLADLGDGRMVHEE